MPAAAREEDVTRVAERLAELPDHYREVIVLRTVEGLPFEEIARRMGKNSAAVRQLWTRAIRRLKPPEQSD